MNFFGGPRFPGPKPQFYSFEICLRCVKNGEPVPVSSGIRLFGGKEPVETGRHRRSLGGAIEVQAGRKPPQQSNPLGQ